MCLSFMRYSTWNNDIPLKSRLGVTGPANLCTIYISLNSADPELIFWAYMYLYSLLDSEHQRRLYR